MMDCATRVFSDGVGATSVLSCPSWALETSRCGPSLRAIVDGGSMVSISSLDEGSTVSMAALDEGSTISSSSLKRGSTVSLSSLDIKEDLEGALFLVTFGEGRIKRLRRTKSRHAPPPKTIMLRLVHTHGKDLFTVNNINAINTFKRSRILIFQTRPAAGTSRHRRCICCKVSIPCRIFALLCP